MEWTTVGVWLLVAASLAWVGLGRVPSSHRGKSRRPVILSVEGVIGAGKSTLLRRLKEALGPRVVVVQEEVELWRALPEPTGNGAQRHNLLQAYYDDAEKYAVPFQAFTLATRVAALDRALADVGTDVELVLVERSSGGDACFATMLHAEGVIDDAWFAAYHYVRALYARFVPDVDGIIDMGVPVEVAMARLHERARGEEVGVTADYQVRLHDTIRAWLASETKPVMCLRPAEWEGLHADDAQRDALARLVLVYARAVARDAM